WRSRPRSGRRFRRSGCGRGAVRAACAYGSCRGPVKPKVWSGPRLSRASPGRASTAAPSEPGPWSPAGEAAKRPSSARRVRPSAYASARSMRTLSSRQKRLLRVAGTLTVTGLCTAYIVWKIDITTTLHILAHADFVYFLGAVAIMVSSVWPMAWRWQKLLEARAIRDRLSWLGGGPFLALPPGQGAAPGGRRGAGR